MQHSCTQWSRQIGKCLVLQPLQYKWLSYWLPASPPLYMGPISEGCLVHTASGQISHTILEHTDPIPQKRPGGEASFKTYQEHRGHFILSAMIHPPSQVKRKGIAHACELSRFDMNAHTFGICTDACGFSSSLPFLQTEHHKGMFAHMEVFHVFPSV